MLFIGSIMFFITNDQAQILKRKKHRGPGPKHYFQFAALYFIPYLHSFILRKFGMIDTDISAKMFLQPPNDLRGKCDLRQHIQHLFALPDQLFDEFYINKRFTAAGYAVQQDKPAFSVNDSCILVSTSCCSAVNSKSIFISLGKY